MGKSAGIILLSAMLASCSSPYTPTPTPTSSQPSTSTPAPIPVPAPPTFTAGLVISPSPAPVDDPTFFTVGITGHVTAPLSVAWDFGDGATAAGADLTASHAYRHTGTVTAAVRVTDATGFMSASAATVIIHERQTFPPAYQVRFAVVPNPVGIGTPTTATVAVLVFNGALPPTRYEWDCAGDRIYEKQTTDPAVTCTYAVPGSVWLWVRLTGPNASAEYATPVTVQ